MIPLFKRPCSINQPVRPEHQLTANLRNRSMAEPNPGRKWKRLSPGIAAA